MDNINSKVWISPQGVSHIGEYHTSVAKCIFPHSENPEYSCEKAGYLKVYILFESSSVRAMTTGFETQAQLNELDELTDKYHNRPSG